MNMGHTEKKNRWMEEQIKWRKKTPPPKSKTKNKQTNNLFT